MPVKFTWTFIVQKYVTLENTGVIYHIFSYNDGCNFADFYSLVGYKEFCELINILWQNNAFSHIQNAPV